jgi:hypothetical protein
VAFSWQVKRQSSAGSYSLDGWMKTLWVNKMGIRKLHNSLIPNTYESMNA